MSIYDKFHLSHTGRNKWRSCERKWLLGPLSGRDNSIHTEFGTALGRAFQEYAVSHNYELAVLRLLQTWTWQFTDERSHKTFWTALQALELMIDEFPWEEYQLWTYNGKPAVELGFEFRLPGNDPEITYLGYIDAVFERISDGTLVPWDVKTTGDNKSPDLLRVKYANDEQLPGYQIVLHSIAPDRKCEEIVYFVAQFSRAHFPSIHQFEFETRKPQRQEFLLSLLADGETMRRQLELGHFPMRGNACLAWGRQCPFFGTCDLHGMIEDAKDASRSDHIDPATIWWRGDIQEIVKEQL